MHCRRRLVKTPSAHDCVAVFLVPLALAVGALGYFARGRRRVVLVLVVSAPLLSVLAFALQFVPGGVEMCRSSTAGAELCKSLPAVSAWEGPLPYAIASALVLLSLAPLASVRTERRWPAVVSSVLQAIPQVISFGGFVDWAPALAATIAVAFAMGSRLHARSTG